MLDERGQACATRENGGQAYEGFPKFRGLKSAAEEPSETLHPELVETRTEEPDRGTG